MNLLIIGFAFLGGREVAMMLVKKGYRLRLSLAGLLGALLPAGTYLELLFPRLEGILLPLLTAGAGLVLLTAGFARSEETIGSLLNSIPGYLTVLLYPGFFLTYMVRLSSFEQASAVILIFIALGFSNDSFAYLIGILLGKSNRGLFKVSPNKSVAGLLGGLAGAVAAALITDRIFPDIFSGKTGMLLLTAFLTSFLAVAGDLIESAFKRSAGVKDSGNLLGGRGGVMDSLDSLLYCAPVFYYLLKFLQ